MDYLGHSSDCTDSRDRSALRYCVGFSNGLIASAVTGSVMGGGDVTQRVAVAPATPLDDASACL